MLSKSTRDAWEALAAETILFGGEEGRGREEMSTALARAGRKFDFNIPISSYTDPINPLITWLYLCTRDRFRINSIVPSFSPLLVHSFGHPTWIEHFLWLRHREVLLTRQTQPSQWNL